MYQSEFWILLYYFAGGKKVVASLPPSDEEYDTGDNWSTASVLSEDISSISEDGMYKTGQRQNFSSEFNYLLRFMQLG